MKTLTRAFALAVLVVLAATLIVAQTPALQWSATGLPTGLAMDPATGQITGTPKKSGTFPIVITVTEPTSGQSDTQTLQLTINPKLKIKSTSLASATLTEGTYTFQVDAELITSIP